MRGGAEMKCSLERLKPEELILPQDLVQQVAKQLGDRHPAVRYLEYYLMANQSSLPEHLQQLVADDWLWFIHYPFWVLSRLAKSNEVVPACWVRTSELRGLTIPTSDIFSLPPDAMKKEFASVLSSWRRIYPVLAQKRRARLRAPDKLGEGWLEAYAAGVGSPLELKFLRLFDEHGLNVEKQVLVSPSDNLPPISVADFALPGKRVAIYIDGASFHMGSNLRRDRFIRKRLKTGDPPWRIVELRAVDLTHIDRVIREMRGVC